MDLRVHHVCIQTEKYEESLDFYTRILGFKIIKETENFHKREYNTWLSLGDFMIELQTKKEGDILKPGESQMFTLSAKYNENAKEQKVLTNEITLILEYEK